MSSVYKSQEFEISSHSKRAKSKTEKMDGINQRLRPDHKLPPRKANVVTDALSQKSFVTLAHVRTAYVLLLLDMKTLGISLDYDGYGALLASFMVRQTLVD